MNDNAPNPENNITFQKVDSSLLKRLALGSVHLSSRFVATILALLFLSPLVGCSVMSIPADQLYPGPKRPGEEVVRLRCFGRLTVDGVAVKNHYGEYQADILPGSHVIHVSYDIPRSNATISDTFTLDVKGGEHYRCAFAWTTGECRTVGPHAWLPVDVAQCKILYKRVEIMKMRSQRSMSLAPGYSLPSGGNVVW